MVTRAVPGQGMLSDGLHIGAAALTIAVVWRLSGMLHRAVVEGQQGPGGFDP
ncbi:hypothetical protein [Streptomyces sp. R35]|uniref:Uncharacterized protein n=1 Tax=Streptomyces sp. R35 TaxID=3238630 RepID=A0AB39RWH9_9ACTN